MLVRELQTWLATKHPDAPVKITCYTKTGNMADFNVQPDHLARKGVDAELTDLDDIVIFAPDIP